MVLESPEDPPRPRALSRALLFGGVACAGVLGVGLGLWARPSDGERPGGPAKPALAAAPVRPDRKIEIVVDDTPAPVGKPLDVLPGPPAAAAAPAPAPVAPKRPPAGLVRVDAPAPGPIAPTPTLIRRLPARRAPAEPAPVVGRPRPAPRAARVERHSESHPKASSKAPAKLRKAEGRPAAGPKAAHRIKAREVEAAAAPPKPRARHGLAALAHAFGKLAPHHAKAEPEPSKPSAHRRQARATRPAPEPARPARLAKAAPKAHESRPERVLVAPSAKGAGPIRVAGDRCASADPGAALACGDPGLGAAERRLTRAYREAEAAGVPRTTLQQQQQRWVAARAAAAREAPWAVREVYQARIAELQDQARDARGD